MENIITIVSGLPRSGTSLMMQMLEKGGMTIVADNIRTPDEDNPKGYYEFEKVKKIKDDTSWLKDMRGKVFKMVSLLLYDLPLDETYKIIFMKRDMDELLNSQRKMLERLKRDPGPDDNDMRAYFLGHLSKTYSWLEEENHIDVLYVSYNDLINYPLEEITAINDFLFQKLDTGKMKQVIDKSLYRNRSKIK